MNVTMLGGICCTARLLGVSSAVCSQAGHATGERFRTAVMSDVERGEQMAGCAPPVSMRAAMQCQCCIGRGCCSVTLQLIQTSTGDLPPQHCAAD